LVFAITQQLRGSELASAPAVPDEGVRPEDAIIIARLLKEIAKDLPDDCAEEWEWALEFCAKELSRPNPRKLFTGGHKNIKDCAKGLVSDRCGGNAIPIERPP
jgi:hypothetical protein